MVSSTPTNAMPLYLQIAGVAVFGPAFREQKQSADTNGQKEGSVSSEDAALEVGKTPEPITAIQPSAESAIPQSPARKRPFGSIWPSLSSNWNWRDFWREGDRALVATARPNSTYHESQSIRSMDQADGRGRVPNESPP